MLEYLKKFHDDYWKIWPLSRWMIEIFFISPIVFISVIIVAMIKKKEIIWIM